MPPEVAPPDLIAPSPGLPTVKPLLRGWTHAAAALAAGASTVALCLQSAHDLPRFLSLLVYGLGMVQLYATSALLHIGAWPARVHNAFRALDHAAISVLIAATFTPFCVNLLSGGLRLAVLTPIWLLAATGVLLTIFRLRLPRKARIAYYLAMGWTGVAPALDLLWRLPAPAMLLLVAGALAYSAGAIVYARRRPDPFPRVFGFHEIFHLLVVAGSAAFLAVIWIWVVPFPPA